MSTVAKRLDHGWIKMALAKDVALGPGHSVLDGDTATCTSPKRGQSSSNIRPMSIVAKRLDASR